jgi:hypothetical protein
LGSISSKPPPKRERERERAMEARKEKSIRIDVRKELQVLNTSNSLEVPNLVKERSQPDILGV